MKIKEAEIRGIFEIELDPNEDDRGFFMRTYDKKIFKALGLDMDWVQENHSFNKVKGTIRGFHFQFPPHSETKLVRVVSGSVLDIFLDIRKNSPTFGKWGSKKLSSDNKSCLYLPKGIAHGMCTLEENTTMVYKVDNAYAPDSEGQIKWNDSILGVDWPNFDQITISEKDKNSPGFDEFLKEFGGIDV